MGKMLATLRREEEALEVNEQLQRKGSRLQDTFPRTQQNMQGTERGRNK